MNAVRSITAIACFVGIAISMLDIIRPSERLKKQVRFIFSLVFLIAVLSGILKNNIKLDIKTQDDIRNSEEYIAVSKTYTQCLADNFRKSIEKNLTEKLEINNINVKDVSLKVDISENDEISIKGADIVLPDNSRSIEDKVRTIIQNEIGRTQIDVHYERE